MIPGISNSDRRHQTVIRKYNTLIHNVTRTKGLGKIFKHRNQTHNIKKIYQDTSQNLKWLGFFSALFGVLNIVLIFYEAELYFIENFKVTEQINDVRVAILLICIVHCVNVLFIHLSISKNHSMSYWDSFKDFITTKSRLKYFVSDFLICMTHLPPSISLNFNITQLGFHSKLSCSDIIFSLSLLKLKYLILFIAQQSNESSKKSQIMLNIFPIENNLKFILKCVVHKWTYASFFITFWLSLIGFGALFRVFEKDLSGNSIWDYSWLAFTTESTVGYGDVYPKTHIGRFIAGIISVVGVFLFSYSVMAVRDLTELSKDELKLSGMINFNKKVQKKIIPKALELIVKAWKMYRHKKVKDLFLLIEASKEFSKIRKLLANGLTANFDEQVNDSGRIMSAKINSSLKIFKNIEYLNKEAKRFHYFSHLNYKNLKSLSKNAPSNLTDLTRLKIPGPKQFLKSRKNAVKKLFVRRVANSSASPRNSVLSYSSID